MKKNSKQSSISKTDDKLRKTLVFSKKNADIYDVLEKMKKDNKVNISDYICSLIREDLHKKGQTEIQHKTDNKLDEIQAKLDYIQDLINSKSFISPIESETENNTVQVEIVSAKDIVVEDIDDMLGL